jgi:hypothetical protein
MAMKFPSDKDDIVTVRGKGLESQLYYLESLKIAKAAQEKEKQKEDPKKDSKGKQKFIRRDFAVMMTDLNQRGEFQHQHPEPEGNSIEIQVGDKPKTNLPTNVMKNMTKVLQDNKDIFTWVASDMPWVDQEFCCHRLAIREGSRPIAQKKRRMGQERATTIEAQINELLDAGFIREIQYSDLISNVVMVKKENEKWRMCTDYTGLNKACPKDPFPLPCIDKLVDNSAGYWYLSFLDAGYNQIPMNPDDQDKTSFFTYLGVLCYNVMPFGLKKCRGDISAADG